MANLWSFLMILGFILVTTKLEALWGSHEGTDSVSDCGEPLFLTPLIKHGELKKARENSRVQIMNRMDVESYAGFLTVRDSPDDANLFFWFFPALENKANAPIFLLMPGGPGISGMQILFGENGPYYITSNGTVDQRTDHWAIHFNVIYLDAPVGSGFSFASSIAAYNQNLTATGKDLLEGILQFFILFSEYATNDFYILGESYAGKQATILVKELHAALQSNESGGASVSINLKGMIGLSAILTYNYISCTTDHVYINGLLTEEQHHYEKPQEILFQEAVVKGDSEVARTCVQMTVTQNTSAVSPQSHRKFSTGFENLLNLAQSKKSTNLYSYEAAVQQPYMRRALHVGDLPFHKRKNAAVVNSMSDIWKSVTQDLEDILNLDYKILLVYCTNDLLFVPLSALKMVSSLQWKGTAQFNATERIIWKLHGNSEVIGYVIPGQDLWFAIVRNSGHLPLFDQPQASFDIITHFILNNSTF